MTKLLRTLSAAGFTTKGSQLTQAELDQNQIDLKVDTDGNTAAIAALPSPISALQDIADVDTYTGNAGKSLTVNGAEDGTSWVKQASSANVWTFQTQTASPPSDGAVRFDNTTYANITKIFIDNETANGIDVSTALLLYLLDDEIYIQQGDNADAAVLFKITGPVIDQTTFVEYDVVHLGNTGTNIANNTEAVVRFDKLGAAAAAVFAAINAASQLSGKPKAIIRVNAAANAFELKEDFHLITVDDANASVTTINTTGVFEDVVITPVTTSSNGFSMSGNSITNNTGASQQVKVVLQSSIISAGGAADRFSIKWKDNGGTLIDGRFCDSSSSTVCGSGGFTIAPTIADAEVIDLVITNLDNGSNVTMTDLTIDLITL